MDASSIALATLFADCVTTRMITTRQGGYEINPVIRALDGPRVDPVRCTVGAVGLVEAVRLFPRKDRNGAYKAIAIVDASFVARNIRILVRFNR